MSVHTCHAHGCTRSVPPKMFACREHWYSLRKVTRAAIWREYRPGQEKDKQPSTRYLAVQRFAVGEMAFKPNDEEACAIAAAYIKAALEYQQVALAEGLGDPLEGLT